MTATTGIPFKELERALDWLGFLVQARRHALENQKPAFGAVCEREMFVELRRLGKMSAQRSRKGAAAT